MERAIGLSWDKYIIKFLARRYPDELCAMILSGIDLAGPGVQAWCGPLFVIKSDSSPIPYKYKKIFTHANSAFRRTKYFKDGYSNFVDASSIERGTKK